MDLEASDMLDVVHVLFEEDITPRFEEDIKVKDEIRRQLYPSLYKRPYSFASSPQTTRHYGASNEDWENMPELDDVPVESMERKPYLPPTPVEDLPGILDAPLS
jgi:hypothetical protein